MQVRPAGVTVIAAALMILGVISFITSLSVFGLSGISAMINPVFQHSPQLANNMTAGILGMIMAAVQFIVGIGMLQMKRWAWYLAFIAALFGVVEGLVGLFGSGALQFVCAGLGLIIPVIVIFYLLSNEVRAVFGIGQASS
jgi:hypothetical protein